MSEQTLSQKDPYWEERILKFFRDRDYETALPESLAYYKDISSGNKAFPVTTKDKANVVYTVAASAFGIQDRSGILLRNEWNTFFRFVDEYVDLCIKGARENGLKGWFYTNAKTLLSDCLELLCRFDGARLESESRKWVLRFAAVDAPGWGYPPAMKVLREAIFSERITFERPDYIGNTQALCRAWLDIAETAPPGTIPDTAAITNVLSDMAYFQGGENAEDNALEWVKRSLEINPEDRFANMRKKFLEERRVVLQQIRRFNHDTNNTIGGIGNRLDLLLHQFENKDAKLERDLGSIRKGLQWIRGINRFIQNKAAWFNDVNPVEIVKEFSAPYSNQSHISITPESTDVKWTTDSDFLGIAVDNLLKNAQEAFERNKIPVSSRIIEISIFPEEYIIIVKDNAGGVDPEIKEKMFDIYVSSKGIRKKTGLGLWNVATALEKLKGKIIYPDKQPENGSVFKIDLNP